ncbi:MAG: nucleotidyltransferase [Euryarchaeota archaeon]|nr:nucleotidyltransferase [Euryarchaeota archaeon]MBU4138335.1 nucleotidyltransferase [Euryarchaeota archaeon]
MNAEWEETFKSWAQGPGKTEQEKCDNAESAIKKAIAAHPKLSGMDISVFAQGSYRARTNIRVDSDVDICVCLNSIAFSDYPAGKTDKDYGRVQSALEFSEFKNLVHKALIDRFGASSVRRGKKAFDVHANSYRVDADVIPAFEHRRYKSDGSDNYILGIAFKTDDGNLIKNWPKQTYDNGIEKNNATSRRYKRVIRILKNLRNTMQDDKVVAANNIPSFLIECLVWNAPNEGFNNDLYTADVRSVLANTFNKTLDETQCKEWGEVNELKYLFRSGQPWSREQAHSFLSAAWDYIGFE